MRKPFSRKRVIILAIDAMDPKITEQLIQVGKLPNLSYLKTAGTYSHLKTTIPAESVVAWSSFITGLNPGSHGIFDFIMRTPQNYQPYLSLNETSSAKGKMRIQTRRKGEPFWNILSRRKVPCFIYFCPNTFPPDAVFGKMISGMGVTDITGTMGTYSFYTSKELSEEDRHNRGKIIHTEPKGNIIDTEIYGPKISTGALVKEGSVSLRITLLPETKRITLRWQGNQFDLEEGSWSDWQKLSFKVGPLRKIYGIMRFYLKSIKPDFQLYVSPINFDPQRPLFPISYPHNTSRKLAKKVGLYYTQGMPHDTWALTENKIDEKAFLEQVDEVLNERKKILKEELKEYKSGLFFFYFDTLDTVQHMFWRFLDTQHPLYERNSLYQDTVFKYYEKIDQIIGEALKNTDKDTTLIVLSDHGFSSFRRAVHLNHWLLENGYLFLKKGITEGRDFFEGVDWSKTKAYALGFGGIYLNRIGREYYGIVGESEANDLKKEIKERLGKFQDPKTSGIVVKNIYAQEDVFKGPYINDSPDLFVGFNEGYRASWQTALGGVPNLLIEDNNRKWSGDHLIDSNLVPGVIFMNKKMDLNNPSIIDIAPTILYLFDILAPIDMPGEVLSKNEDK